MHLKNSLIACVVFVLTACTGGVKITATDQDTVSGVDQGGDADVDADSDVDSDADADTGDGDTGTGGGGSGG